MSLISAGLSLVSGLFGNSSKKKAEAKADAKAVADLHEQRVFDINMQAENREYNRELMRETRAYDADAPRRNIMSQLEGIEQGAASSGFNRLTLLQGGQTGGGGSSGSISSGVVQSGGINRPPPLASVDLLSGAFSDLADVLTGEDARRQASNQLEYDLGVLKLNQLKGQALVVPTATSSPSMGASPLGKRSAEVLTPSFMTPINPFSVSPITRSVLSDPVLYREGIDGGVAIPEPRLDRGSGAFAFGQNIIPIPGFSGTQTIEDGYGDAASWAYGLAKAPLDLGWTAGTRLAERYKNEWLYSHKPSDAPRRRPSFP